ncbi:MAG: hypothetical protein JWM21_1171 [Acidobacteria bacterium]|nr:hypothetical protein [Acidobacteriota bacterium]
MVAKKANKKKANNRRKEILDTPRIKSFVAITLAYAALVALLALLFGTTFATFVSTPIWAFLYLIFSKWSQERGRLEFRPWRQLLTFPKLNYSHIFLITVVVVFVQGIAGFIFAFLQERTDPELFYSVPKNLVGALDTLTNDPLTVAVLILVALISYIIGGWVSSKLARTKPSFPYRNAVAAVIIYNLISYSLLVPLAMITGEADPPSTKEIGYIILATSPGYLFAAFGTWIGLKTNIRKRLYQIFSWAGTLKRRLFLGLVCAIVFGTTCFGLWLFARKFPKPLFCENPPSTARLNYWAVMYSGSSEPCHDYPSVDARLVNSDHYSRNREEWEGGLTAHLGDEIYVLVYINNGAGDNAEQENPGYGIARDVRLTTSVDAHPGNNHNVRVEFAGSNTNTVVNQFKIITPEGARLEVMPMSGETYSYIGSLISKGLDVGNATVLLGDLPPKWQSSIFIRFRVRVVA